MEQTRQANLNRAASVYIPADWQQAIASGEPLPERTEGAALFADISGFTPLTEALAQTLGRRRGAEELPRHLNQVYDALIAEVNRYGGSVIGFAGDAITCWFEDGAEPAAGRATACALSMQEAMLRFAAVPIPGQDPVPLSIKTAVASGPARRFLVGDPDLQLIPALAGETLVRMAAAESLAQRGEVVVDAQTAAQLGERAKIAAWRRLENTEPESASFAVIDRLLADVEPAPWPPLAADALSKDQVRPWVLPPVYARLQAGLGDFMTELRPAVALFLRFGGIDYDADDAAGAKLDSYIRWVQHVLARYEGTLVQLTIGEKGNYLYAAFGAPIAHEDDAQRAVLTALTLRTPPAELRFIQATQIGICRGTMRTGTYGGSTRRTYGSLGDQVNLAARLMQYAQPGQVIVNQNVQKVVAGAFTWELLPAIQVKGKSESVEIARLVGKAQARIVTAASTGALIGRQTEVAHQARALGAVEKRHHGLLLVEGQAGVGKSRLVAELAQMAQNHNLDVLLGAGQSIEQHSPYRAWRDLFATFFEEDDPARIRDMVLDLAPDHLSHLPLLNDLLGLGLPETDEIASLDPAQRQAALVELLLALLQGQASRQPLILILEDAQWLDSLSWKLAQRVAKLEAPILLIVVARPLDEKVHAQEQIAHLQALPHAETISLEPLGEEEMIAVAAARLGLPADGLPPPVVDLLRQRAGGNPFFAEQLVLTLQDQGLVFLEDTGTELCCVASDDLATAGRIRQALPETIQGLVLARIDRLPLERQLVLKVAAVIGRTFAYNPLSHTLKQHAPISEAALTSHLGALDARELALLQLPEPELTYVFKHLTIWDIAYQTMSYAQRRRLHRDVARWYEGAYTADLSPVFALLAHHWSGAEDVEQATHYLLLAGDEARRLYALLEAIEYYQRALAFLHQGEDFEQTARTLMKLGLTYHLAFDYRAACEAHEEGFALWQRAAESPAPALPPAERPFRADWPYLPLTLDPGQAGDIDTVGVLDQLYSGLVSLGSGLEVTPDVARRWEILDNGHTYVFHLRNDIRWSDGVPLTAADFVYAWQRVLDPARESPVASTLYDVRGARAFHQGKISDPESVAVRAVDDCTLVVELEQPTSYFPYLLAFSASYPVPRHVVETHGEDWTRPEHLVTNGPYRLAAWEQKNDQDGVLALVRNPDYHGRFGGNAERVELLARPTETERLDAYESGNLDMLSFRNLSGDRDRIRQRHAGEYLSVPFLATTYLAFNPTQPPFDNPQVRQALVLAVDREQHADVNLKGFSFPATGGFVPPGMPGHMAGAGLPYDPDRARELLAQSGYGNGDFPAVEFLAGPGQEPITAYLTSQWRENLGLEIEGQILDWMDFIECLETAPPHIFLNIWVNDYPDPDNFLRASKALGWSRWQDAAYRDLVETARQVPDQGRRLDLYREAEEILVEAAAIVPFSYWRSHMLVQPWVKRFPTSAIKWWYWKDVLMENLKEGEK